MVNIVAGDYGFDMNFTVTDSDGAALNLTSVSSVLFKTRIQGTSGEAALIGSCTIDVAASGTCHYTVEENDMDDVGRFEWELEAIYSNKKLTSLGSEAIVIKTNIP